MPTPSVHVYLGLSLLLLTFNAGSTVLNQASLKDDNSMAYSPYVCAATTEFIKLIVAVLLLSKDLCTAPSSSLNKKKEKKEKKEEDGNNTSGAFLTDFGRYYYFFDL